MKNKKGSNAVLAGIVIVLIIVLALVVPWTLSLIDSTPSNIYATQFKYEVGSDHVSWVAQQIEFTDAVEVTSLDAELRWAAPVGPCTISGQIQIGDTVGASPVIQFASVTYTPESPPPVWHLTYSALTVGGTFLSTGEYYLALRAECVAMGDGVDWMWKHSAGEVSTSPVGIAELGDSCNDLMPQNGLFHHCNPFVCSLVVGGNVYAAPPPTNVTEEEAPPPLIDAKTGMAYEYDWIMYAILGGVIIIVLVVIVVAVKF